MSDQINRIAHSLDEISKMLGCSKGFLALEIKRGHLKAVKRGRRIFILRTEFERYAGIEAQGQALSVSAGVNPH